jgi:hypothetical protein
MSKGEEPLALAGGSVPGNARAEGRIFTCGLFLFAFAFVLNAVSNQIQSNQIDEAVVFLVFGALSVAGLVLITIADLDINDYLRHNQLRMIAFVLIFTVSIATEACKPDTAQLWLMNCPFLVLLLRYKHVVEMRQGYPLFTQLLLASLVFDLLAGAITAALATPTDQGNWYWAAASLFSALSTFGVGYWYGPGEWA